MKNSVATILTFGLILVVFGFTGPTTAQAATSPTLAGSASYSVLGATTVTCTGSATVTGDVGVAAGAAITGFPSSAGSCTVGPPGTEHSNDASAIAAQADNLTAFGTLNGGANADANCINPATGLTGVAPDATDLTGLSLVPGLYCSAGSFLLTGNLTLAGTGVWVFKMVSALNTIAGSSITGGDPCNVWWRVGSSAVLGTTTSFIGNILALTDISLATGATLNGRAMVQTGQVTLDANTISGPVCAAAPSGGGGGGGGGSIVSSILIDLLKAVSPTSLPSGGGAVTYTYTVRNFGTVPLTSVTLVDDTCSAVTRVSGDTNNDLILDLTETWTYTCATVLTATTTNTATASGTANGQTVTDTAVATVPVVASVTPTPVPPPPGFVLPGAGLPPSEKGAPWGIIIPIAVFISFFAINQGRKKLKQN